MLQVFKYETHLGFDSKKHFYISQIVTEDERNIPHTVFFSCHSVLQVALLSQTLTQIVFKVNLINISQHSQHMFYLWRDAKSRETLASLVCAHQWAGETPKWCGSLLFPKEICMIHFRLLPREDIMSGAFNLPSPPLPPSASLLFIVGLIVCSFCYSMAHIPWWALNHKHIFRRMWVHLCSS